MSAATTQFDKISNNLADAHAIADLLVGQDQDDVPSATIHRIGFMLLDLIEGADTAAKKLFKEYQQRVQGGAS